MCPAIYTTDNGELIIAAHRLELAHPTGYPLFCILGKLSTYLIPFGSIIQRINAMNALFAAAAASVLFIALSEISRRKVAAFVALLFGISPLFWETATYAEVHAFSVLLLSIELLLFLRWRRTRDNRLLCYLALTAGFSLTNHLTTALVLPGLLYGAHRIDRSLIRDRPLVVRSLLLLALPLGAVLIKRRQRKLVGALMMVVVLNVVYSINYTIPDIEAYYFPTMLVLSVFAAVGINFIIERPRAAAAKALASLTLLVLLVIAGLGQLPRADKHDARFVTDYAHNVLRTVEKNAMLIACGDSAYNALLYAKVVEGKRPDVILFDRNILRLWRNEAPDYTARYFYESISERSPAMRRFRRPSNYTRFDMIGERFLADVVAAAVKERPVYLNCTGGRNQEHPILKRLKGRCKLLPEGVVYRILPETQEVDKPKFAGHSEELWRTYQVHRIYDGSIRGGDLERDIPNRYAALHTVLGGFELEAGMYTDAARNFSLALRINKDITRTRNGLAVALACQGNYRAAAKEWKTVLLRHPDNKTALRNLALTRGSLSTHRP